MVTTSDIPDWCWVEACGLDACPGGVAATPGGPHLAALERMWRASPLRYVTEPVAGGPRAAFLLLLGFKDRRVPPSQGVEYYNALRALRATQSGGGAVDSVRLFAYPEDVHAIDKPASEADAWIQTALWLLAYAGPGAVDASRALLLT